MLFDGKKDESKGVVVDPFEPQFADEETEGTPAVSPAAAESNVSPAAEESNVFTADVESAATEPSSVFTAPAQEAVVPSEDAPLPETVPFTKESYKRPMMDGPDGKVTDPQTGKIMSRLAYDTKVVFVWLGANAATLPQEVLRAAQEIRPRAFGLGVDVIDPLVRHERAASKPRAKKVGSASETKAQISLLRVLGMTEWSNLVSASLPVSFTLDEAFERAKMGKKEVEKMLATVVKTPMAHGEVVSRWDKEAHAYVIDSVEPDPEESVIAERRAAALARVSKARDALELMKKKAK